MIDVARNNETNRKLSELYESYTQEFLKEYEVAFEKPAPPRINEFGIIDVEKYDTDNGILFVGKETNHWDDKDFLNGNLFRAWMQDISRNGLSGHGETVEKHPTIWYNTGRWAEAILHPEKSADEISDMKHEALFSIGNIAITNINKVRGGNCSQKSYYKIAYSDVAGKVLRKEIEILKPKIIVTMGTFRPFCYHVQQLNIFDNGTTIITMPHASARKSKKEMLSYIKLGLKAH